MDLRLKHVNGCGGFCKKEFRNRVKNCHIVEIVVIELGVREEWIIVIFPEEFSVFIFIRCKSTLF